MSTVGLPESIGRYRVEAVVGAGGFATVYRAHDERLDATVAVKVLAENHSFDPDVRERFLKEGRVLRRVGSHHVVTVHDLGETERGQPYLVLDYADRGDLASRVATRRAAGWHPGADDLVYVAGAVADALAAVHAGRLVHRDVSPRNLLLSSARAPATDPGCALVGADEQLLLADLGLSKDLASASGLTVGGGTAGYTPPEQRSGMGSVDAAADVWAASALVVWLLLDRPPDDEGQWASAIAGAGWPSALVGALARGLAEAPGDRQGGAAAWFVDVRDAVVPTVPIVAPEAPGPSSPSSVGSPGSPDGSAPPATTALLPPPAGGRHRPRLVLAAALVAACLLGAGAALLVRSWVADDPDGTSQTVEELDGDRVRVSATDGDRTVAIVGPASVPAGETASFTAEVEGVEGFVWLAPDGQVHADREGLDVSTQTAGRAAITLVGVDAQGREVEARHALRVIG